MNRFII